MYDPRHDLWMAEDQLLLMGWIGRLFHPRRARRLRMLRDAAIAEIERLSA